MLKRCRRISFGSQEHRTSQPFMSDISSQVNRWSNLWGCEGALKERRMRREWEKVETGGRKLMWWSGVRLTLPWGTGERQADHRKSTGDQIWGCVRIQALAPTPSSGFLSQNPPSRRARLVREYEHVRSFLNLFLRFLSLSFIYNIVSDLLSDDSSTKYILFEKCF